MSQRSHWLAMFRRRRLQSLLASIALILLCVSLALAALAGTARASAVLLSDDFESDTAGSVPVGWTVDSGTTWSTLVDGSQVLAQTNPNYNNFYGIHAGSSSWTDYTVTASVKPGINSAIPYQSSVRLDGRRQDNNNMYSLSAQSGNMWYLGKRVNGAFTTLAQGSTSYNTTSWYTWALTFNGHTISASINGVILAMVSDGAFNSGNISFWTHSESELDNVVVTTPGGSATPTNTPTATPTKTPSPTEPPTPTVTPTPGDYGAAHLTVSTDANGNVSVTSLDEQQSGWRIIFNPAAGGAITSNSEIDRGTYTELEAQNTKHGRLQNYVQTSGGVFLSNLDNRGDITIVRNTPGLVGIQTITTNTTYQVRWTSTYYLWPDGEVYMAMTVTNIGTSALKLSSYHSMEVDFGGLALSVFKDTVNQAWYEFKGAAITPIPLSTISQEAAQFSHVPSPGGPLTLGLLIDKYTAWTSQGISNAGGQETQNTYRAKDQWFGNLTQFSAGASVTFTLLYDQRRNLTQSQSLAIDADYRAPGITVSTGALATTDTEPSTMSLTNGYNRYTGDYVVKTTDNHVTAQLDTSKVQTRFTPRFKFTGWTKGEPTLTWGNTTLTAGTDYTCVLDADSTTLYVQLNFDVVSSAPSSGQRVNAPLTIA